MLWTNPQFTLFKNHRCFSFSMPALDILESKSSIKNVRRFKNAFAFAA